MSEETSDCETQDFTKSPPAKKRKKSPSSCQNSKILYDDRSACSTCYLQAIDIEEKDLADQYRLLKVDAPAGKPRVVGIKNETPDELKDWEETIGEGIATINHHSPGLWLVSQNDGHPQIVIAASKKCATKGTIHQPPAEISLQPGLPKTIQPYVGT